MNDSFATSLAQFGDRIAIIQCSPSKKKKRNSRRSSVTDELPKFVLRFSFKDNALKIDAINLTVMYQLTLNVVELSEHLSASGIDINNTCSWSRFCDILCTTFIEPTSNITLTKGKGGGYMVLCIKYVVTNDMILGGNAPLELGLVDEYCQHEENTDLPSKYKDDTWWELIENRQMLNANDNHKRNSNNMEAKDDDLKNGNESYSELKSENEALRTKIQLLEKENVGLKNMAQNRNNSDMGMFGGNVGLTQNLGATL
eukprot:UN05754